MIIKIYNQVNGKGSDTKTFTEILRQLIDENGAAYEKKPLNIRSATILINFEDKEGNTVEVLDAKSNELEKVYSLYDMQASSVEHELYLNTEIIDETPKNQPRTMLITSQQSK
ncbi:hypothetical protein HF072_14080 [Bacillus sp. RO3]|nr:hypothetical protein [Bacillus sp. RO3]